MRYRQYTPLSKKRSIQRECAMCWYGLLCAVAFAFGALIYFLWTVVYPIAFYEVPVVHAQTEEEVCANLWQYTNAEDFISYCNEI